jgi:hypothetical protein
VLLRACGSVCGVYTEEGCGTVRGQTQGQDQRRGLLLCVSEVLTISQCERALLFCFALAFGFLAALG